MAEGQTEELGQTVGCETTVLSTLGNLLRRG